MIKVLNNCPSVVPYITSTIAGLRSHIQQHPNTEYKSYLVTFMIHQLRTSGIYMNVRITTPSNRFNNFNNSNSNPTCTANRLLGFHFALSVFSK